MLSHWAPRAQGRKVQMLHKTSKVIIFMLLWLNLWIWSKIISSCCQRLTSCLANKFSPLPSTTFGMHTALYVTWSVRFFSYCKLHLCSRISLMKLIIIVHQINCICCLKFGQIVVCLHWSESILFYAKHVGTATAKTKKKAEKTAITSPVVFFQKTRVFFKPW